MCPPPHLGGDSHLGGSSNFVDPVIYSPTSTPLAWCLDLYVQELLRAKRGLELLEGKEQESYRNIHVLIAANKALADNNNVLKAQISTLEETLLAGKLESQNMKDGWKNLNATLEANKVTVITEPSHNKERTILHTSLLGKAEVEEERSFSEITKTWDKNSKHLDLAREEAKIHVNTQDREVKERHLRASNIIIKGIKDYGKGEHTLDLTRDFVYDVLVWQGQICQAWRVGKPHAERNRPIKVVMPSIYDKQNLLNKKQLLRGSHFVLEEDLTMRQQEERRMEMEKIRTARNEGKRAWMFKGKAIIAHFGHRPNEGQQKGNKGATGAITNTLTCSDTTRSTFTLRDNKSTLSLPHQNK